MRHYFLLTNPSTGGKIQFIFHWNWMMTVFSLHISATLHLSILGTWSNNIKSAQYVICVMIVRELWYIVLAIRYTIWIVAHLCTSRGTFWVLTAKRHSIPLMRLPRVAGGAPAANHKATAIWLAPRILAGNEHCNVRWKPVSEYISSFFIATYECMHPKCGCRICKYLSCIYAKFYKHIGPSYYKPDVQSLQFCWKCSYWIFSLFRIQGFHKLYMYSTQPILVISL